MDIGGTVEDAQIECGGNILIKQGFTGGGKGLINVKKNISITFMWNQEVKAGEDKPYIVRNKGPYIRVGSTNRPITRYELDEIYRNKFKHPLYQFS